jgi:hypothetical protein
VYATVRRAAATVAIPVMIAAVMFESINGAPWFDAHGLLKLRRMLSYDDQFSIPGSARAAIVGSRRTDAGAPRGPFGRRVARSPDLA